MFDANHHTRQLEWHLLITIISITSIGISASLSALHVSGTQGLRTFPNLTGRSALEYLKIDRAELTRIPSTLCDDVPHLRSL